MHAFDGNFLSWLKSGNLLLIKYKKKIFLFIENEGKAFAYTLFSVWISRLYIIQKKNRKAAVYTKCCRFCLLKLCTHSLAQLFSIMHNFLQFVKKLGQLFLDGVNKDAIITRIIRPVYRSTQKIWDRAFYYYNEIWYRLCQNGNTGCKCIVLSCLIWCAFLFVV